MTKVSNLRTLTNIDPKDSITVAPAYNSYHTSCIICNTYTTSSRCNFCPNCLTNLRAMTVVYINNYSKLGIKGYSKVKRTIVEISQKIVIDHIGNLIYEGIHHGIITIHTSSGKYDISDHVTIVHYKDESYSDNIFNKLKE